MKYGKTRRVASAKRSIVSEEPMPLVPSSPSHVSNDNSPAALGRFCRSLENLLDLSPESLDASTPMGPFWAASHARYALVSWLECVVGEDFPDLLVESIVDVGDLFTVCTIKRGQNTPEAVYPCGVESHQ